MKNIPWKGIFIGCSLMTVLVIAKCVTTAGRHLYYGGRNWANLVFSDPWCYVGIAAACVGVIACIMWRKGHKKAVAE